VLHLSHFPQDWLIFPSFLSLASWQGLENSVLYNAILSAVRIMDGGSVGLAVGSTGIAANLLHLGRTLHSRFKVPLNITSESVCNIDAQCTLAKMIRMSKVIVWDEAPM
jgi:hypothetical protein